MKILILSLLLLLTTPQSIAAQTRERRNIRWGNKAYAAQQYDLAESFYRKALAENPHSAHATFNLGDCLLAKKNNKAAMVQYERVTKSGANKMLKAMAHHNMGYIHHTKQEFDKAIEEYKEALRNNPNDEDTRYNLVLAQKQRQQQSKQQKQQQPKQKNDKSKDQEKKEKNKEQKEKNQAQKSSVNDNSKSQNEQKRLAEQQQIEKEKTEQLLRLARQAEQQTLERIQRAKRPPRKQEEKNW